MCWRRFANLRVRNMLAALVCLAVLCQPEVSGANFSIPHRIWSSPIIPTCFRPSEYAQNPALQDAVKEAVRDSWEAESAVVFDWSNEPCPDGLGGEDNDGWLKVDLVHSGGRSSCGADTGQCEINVYCNVPNHGNADSEDEYRWCIKEVVPHEFGHALAFRHEHWRGEPDTPCDVARGNTNQLRVGACDPCSVMMADARREMFCSAQGGYGARLSHGDVAGVQYSYGSPQPAQGIRGPFLQGPQYYVFARGTDWQWRYSSPPAIWEGYAPFTSNGPPSVASFAPDRVDMFFRVGISKPYGGAPFTQADQSLDGTLYHDTTGGPSGDSEQVFPGLNWMGGVVSMAPGPDQFEVFGRSYVGAPFRAYYNGSWHLGILGGAQERAASDLAVARMDADRLQVFWRWRPRDKPSLLDHPDLNRIVSQVVHIGSGAHGPRKSVVGMYATSAPSTVWSREDQNEVFYRGIGGEVMHRVCGERFENDPDGCNSSSATLAGLKITNGPEALSAGVKAGFRDDIWVFARGVDGYLWMNKLPSGQSSFGGWDGWSKLADRKLLGAPKAANYNEDWIQLFWRGTDNHLNIGYLHKSGGFFFSHDVGGQIR